MQTNQLNIISYDLKIKSLKERREFLLKLFSEYTKNPAQPYNIEDVFDFLTSRVISLFIFIYKQFLVWKTINGRE